MFSLQNLNHLYPQPHDILFVSFFFFFFATFNWWQVIKVDASVLTTSCTQTQKIGDQPINIKIYSTAIILDNCFKISSKNINYKFLSSALSKHTLL